MDNPLWREFFKFLRPSWKQPSRFLCAGRLLDEEYHIARTALDDEISESTQGIGISLDGWTNVNSDPILNVALLLPEPRYLKSVDTSNLKQDKDYIFKVIREIIQSIGEEKIVSINTDNAASMKAAGDLVRAEFPKVLFVGCAAHWYNLLIKDLCEAKQSKPGQPAPTSPSTVNIASQVRLLVNEIKRPGKLLQKFKEISAIAKKSNHLKGNLVISFSPTRFAGCAASMESVLGARAVINTLVPVSRNQSEEVVTSRVKESLFSLDAELLVKSETFWKSLTKTSRLLKPIKEAIMCLQSDDKGLADICVQTFKILEDTFSLIEKEDFPDRNLLKKIIKRRCDALLKPEALAAYYLHPMYRGEKLSREQRDAAFSFIVSFGHDFGYDSDRLKKLKESFLKYRTNIDREFNNAVCQDEDTRMQPLHWWEIPNGHEELKAIALHLHAIVPSSAAIERYNSTNKLIQSNLRNRLSNPKTEKMMLINRWLFQCNKNTLKKVSEKVSIAVPELVTISDDEPHGLSEDSESTFSDEDSFSDNSGDHGGEHSFSDSSEYDAIE